MQLQKGRTDVTRMGVYESTRGEVEGESSRPARVVEPSYVWSVVLSSRPVLCLVDLCIYPSTSLYVVDLC